MPEDIQGLHEYLGEKKVDCVKVLRNYSDATLAAIANSPYIPESLQEVVAATKKIRMLDWLIQTSVSFSSVDSFENAIGIALKNAQTPEEKAALGEELDEMQKYRTYKNNNVQVR